MDVPNEDLVFRMSVTRKLVAVRCKRAPKSELKVLVDTRKSHEPGVVERALSQGACSDPPPHFFKSAPRLFPPSGLAPGGGGRCEDQR